MSVISSRSKKDSSELVKDLRNKAEVICSLKRKQRAINKVYVIVFTICLSSMLIGRSLIDSIDTHQQAEEQPSNELETDYNDTDIFVFF